MIRVILIDDEKHFINTLRAICTSIPDIEILAEARSVSEGVTVIENHKPDLVFLDVEMDDGTGFDLLRKLKNIDFQVIFITAHDRYAIEAFKFSAQNYLLKPLISTDFFNAIEKVRELLGKERITKQLEALMHNMQSLSRDNKKIVLKESEAIHIVNIDEILWCTAEGSYCTFVLSDKRKITISRNLREYDELLSSSGFFRIHRSYLVNLNKVKKFDKTEGGSLILDDGSSLPVSVRKREDLLKALSSI